MEKRKITPFKISSQQVPPCFLCRSILLTWHSNYMVAFYYRSLHLSLSQQASPVYQQLEILQEHGIAINDIQKLQNAGYHTIESVC